jgi:hypothetical protein
MILCDKSINKLLLLPINFSGLNNGKLPSLEQLLGGLSILPAVVSRNSHGNNPPVLPAILVNLISFCLYLRVKKHTCCYTSSNLALGSKFARVPARG